MTLSESRKSSKPQKTSLYQHGLKRTPLVEGEEEPYISPYDSTIYNESASKEDRYLALAFKWAEEMYFSGQASKVVLFPRTDFSEVVLGLLLDHNTHYDIEGIQKLEYITLPASGVFNDAPFSVTWVYISLGELERIQAGTLSLPDICGGCSLEAAIEL